MSVLDALFAPRRLALLGVSRDPAKLGHVLLKNVITAGFPGEIHVVNPAGESILGLPTVPRVGDLPRGLDLALISLPPVAVLEAVEGLAALGARAAVILTSGFGEVDDRGGTEQQKLLQAARKGGLRLVGPNCMGVYSRPARLNATYFWDVPDAPGHVGIISQSGAYGGLMLRHLGGRGIGVSRFLSIGNQADVGIADALDYLATDVDTRLVACFIEAVRDGQRFVESASRATALKPVLVLKAGRTEAGRRAAGSHTGSLAGAAEAYQAAFRRAGVLASADTEEFFDSIHALVSTPSRPARPSVAVITVSGGPSVIAADAAEAAGIAVPAMAPETQDGLRQLLPAFAAVGNPIDMTPQVNPQHIASAAALVLEAPAIGGLVAINVGLDIPAFADGLVNAARAAEKPLVACAVDVPNVITRLTAAGTAVYPTPERAVRAYRALWLASTPRGPRTASAPGLALPSDLAHALAEARGTLGYELARDLVTAYGIRFCRDGLARSVDEAVAAADALGYPVVVKSARPDLLHRTEAAAVMTRLRGRDEVRAAADGLARLGHMPLLVQEHVPGVIELLVGGRRDPTFGPIVVVGLGGFLAEAVRDISTALAPVSLEEAQLLVREGVRARLFGGYRGLPPEGSDAAARAVVALGALLADQPRVSEVDVNPLLIRGGDAIAVDALVLVGT
jgi:acetate---CoA ligase (ADP-forming)